MRIARTSSRSPNEAMEVVANEVFDLYRAQYYEDGSVSSAYFWNKVAECCCCALISFSFCATSNLMGGDGDGTSKMLAYSLKMLAAQLPRPPVTSRCWAARAATTTPNHFSSVRS